MADYSGAIQWLLGSSDPSIRYLALTEVLGRSPSDQEASQCRDLITGSSRIRNLLSGQKEDGGFGKDPYRKWDGAHWRLVSLVNLAIPPNDSQALKVAENVLDWIYLHASRGRFPVREGRPRMHASVYANPVGACSYLGMGKDRRIEFLCERNNSHDLSIASSTSRLPVALRYITSPQSVTRLSWNEE